MDQPCLPKPQEHDDAEDGQHARREDTSEGRKRIPFLTTLHDVLRVDCLGFEAQPQIAFQVTQKCYAVAVTLAGVGLKIQARRAIVSA